MVVATLVVATTMISLLSHIHPVFLRWLTRGEQHCMLNITQVAEVSYQSAFSRRPIRLSTFASRHDGGISMVYAAVGTDFGGAGFLAGSVEFVGSVGSQYPQLCCLNVCYSQWFNSHWPWYYHWLQYFQCRHHPGCRSVCRTQKTGHSAYTGGGAGCAYCWQVRADHHAGYFAARVALTGYAAHQHAPSASFIAAPVDCYRHSDLEHRCLAHTARLETRTGV